MTVSSIYGQLEKGAKLSPDSVAILAPERAPLSFSRLLAQAREVVTRLNALGIHRNDRVAIVLPNGPEMAVAFLSIACGAAAAPLNPAYGASEFDFYLSDLEAKALVIQAGVTSPSVEVAQARGIPVIEIEPKLEGPAGLFGLLGAKPTLRLVAPHRRDGGHCLGAPHLRNDVPAEDGSSHPSEPVRLRRTHPRRPGTHAV